MITSLALVVMLSQSSKVAEVKATVVVDDIKFVEDLTLVQKDVQSVSKFFTFDEKQVTIQPRAIPESVLNYSHSWLSKILDSNISRLYDNVEWKGYTSKSHIFEPLIAQARTTDLKITWSDNEAVAAIMVETGVKQQIETEAEAKDYVSGLLARYLKLPARENSATKYMIHKKNKDVDIWSGYVARGVIEGDGGRFKTPNDWDCSIFVVTNGKSTVFRVRLQDSTTIGASKYSGEFNPKRDKLKSRFDSPSPEAAKSK